MDEILDIVNEKNEVIGEAEYHEAHQKGLRHRTSEIIILNDKNEILLQKRTEDAPTEPNLWTTSAGGHLTKGQTFEQAAVNELKEEIGITTLLTKIELYTHDYTFPNGKIEREFNTLFFGKHNGPFKVQESEVADTKLIDVEKLYKEVEKNPSNFTKALISALKVFREWKNEYRD